MGIGEFTIYNAFLSSALIGLSAIRMVKGYLDICKKSNKVWLTFKLTLGSKVEVEKLTGRIVKEAVNKLKAKKTDVSGSYVSDALKNAPDLLYEQLASVFRSWLYHGTVTPSLLACSFMPLLKSLLKDPLDSSSYRAIAGSSLVLKTFELVVILLWGHLLSSDSLQFGYKAKTSTTHCTWLVNEVVQHMLRGGIYPLSQCWTAARPSISASSPYYSEGCWTRVCHP